jgi:hypothetical protein
VGIQFFHRWKFYIWFKGPNALPRSNWFAVAVEFEFRCNGERAGITIKRRTNKLFDCTGSRAFWRGTHELDYMNAWKIAAWKIFNYQLGNGNIS